MIQMRNCLSQVKRYVGIGSFFLVFFHLSWTSLGQDRCAVTHEHYVEDPKQFEGWLRKLREVKAHKPNNDVLTIPVVFHIIHGGEPVGEGRNLSVERIEQQMATLNADFRRTNTDASSTPIEFLSVATDVEIEFVLAKQDPNGLPTNGITRTQGRQENYGFPEDEVLKSESYWPAEDYMNVYVADLSGFLGWASFPFSNLAGITEINNDRLTDGVALDYSYVGLNPDAGEFPSLGRTGTHEVGHFLGLKHLWGDCSVDDFCSDTPASNTSYQNECPSGVVSSCGSSDMYSNYLNYTDDSCMNLFTACQRERMRTVLTNSIRRKSLLTSPALQEPIEASVNLGIQNILAPTSGICDASITPSVELRNFGTNPISEIQVQLWVAGTLVDTQSRSLMLASDEQVIVTFTPFTLSENMDQTLEFRIVSVNGGTDDDTSNDVRNILVAPAQRETIPYSLNFESSVDLITRTEISESSLWQVETAPFNSIDNEALRLNFYNNPENIGEFHHLLLPNLDYSNLNSAELSFNYAYSGVEGLNSKDGLILAASTDCGSSFDRILFSRYGENLVTTERSISGAFVPSGPGDWREVSINITSLLEFSDLRFAFIGQNGAVNHIYVDDIRVEATELQAFDLGISDVTQFPVVTCSDFLAPRVTVTNYGFETITSYDLRFDLSGQVSTNSFTSSLISGSDEDRSVPISDLNEGTYSLTISTQAPNGQSDGVVSNDSFTRSFIIDQSEETLPIRENFDNTHQWVSISPSGSNLWALFTEEGNTSYQVEAFGSTGLGTQHWLVSPVLNTGNLTEGTLQFDLAYATNGVATDRLQVLLSVNCGQSYDVVLFDRSGGELSTSSNTTSSFVPGSGDWSTESIDLSNYVNWREIRLAFVFTNGGGNNLYIDNVETIPVSPQFVRQFQNPLTIYPQPATEQEFTVALNLTHKTEVVLTLLDISGKVVAQFREPNGLNQTYQFLAPNLAGIYLLRISGPGLNISRPILISR